MARPRTPRIGTRLRRMFAEDREEVLILHLVIALALLPIPALLVWAVYFPSAAAPSVTRIDLLLRHLIWFDSAVISMYEVPFFLVWTLPEASRRGLPVRTTVFLTMLIVFYPFHLSFERLDAGFSAVWAFKHVDALVLAGLGLWAIRRSRIALPVEKVWFHWLLLFCSLWALFGFFEREVGWWLMDIMFPD